MRLAISRTNKAIYALRIIENLSSRPRNYSYTDDDIEKVFHARQEEFKECLRKFLSGQSGKRMSSKSNKGDCNA